MADIYRNFKNSEPVEENRKVPEPAESGGRGSESFDLEGSSSVPWTQTPAAASPTANSSKNCSPWPAFPDLLPPVQLVAQPVMGALPASSPASLPSSLPSPCSSSVKKNYSTQTFFKADEIVLSNLNKISRLEREWSEMDHNQVLLLSERNLQRKGTLPCRRR